VSGGHGDSTLYLDESGDHGIRNFSPQYPVLSLCGIAVDDTTYAQVLLPAMDEFKVEHFGTAGVQLHSRAMAQKAGPFRFLADPAKAWAFEQALARLIDQFERRRKRKSPGSP
jgi:hypothetical protein